MKIRSAAWIIVLCMVAALLLGGCKPASNKDLASGSMTQTPVLTDSPTGGSAGSPTPYLKDTITLVDVKRQDYGSISTAQNIDMDDPFFLTERESTAWIYVVSNDKTNAIHQVLRMHSDGTGREVVFNDPKGEEILSTFVDGQGTLYVGHRQGAPQTDYFFTHIFRVDPVTGDEFPLVDTDRYRAYQRVTMYQETIYFTGHGYDDATDDLYRKSADGSDILTLEGVMGYRILGGKILFSYGRQGDKLYSANLDGSGIEEVMSWIPERYSPHEYLLDAFQNHVVLNDNQLNLYLIDTSDKSMSFIKGSFRTYAQIDGSGFFIVRNYLAPGDPRNTGMYPDYDHFLHRISYDGKDNKLVMQISREEIAVIDGWLYFYKLDDTGTEHLFRLKTDYNELSEMQAVY
jgi:hypothetical protein